MRAASASLGSLAETITARASNTKDRALTAKSSTGDVADGVLGVTTAVEQLSASISEIAGKSAEANSVALQAVDLASEARALIEQLGASSNETARATGEISDRIATIQRNTVAAVDANESVNSIISRIAELQQTIAVAVEEQSAVTEQIAEGAGAAAHSTEDIVTTVSAVADDAGETETAGAATGQSALELTNLADDLGRLVGSS